jgi:hypothetical protein
MGAQLLHLLGYDLALELVGADVAVLMPEPYASQHSTRMQEYVDKGVAKV